MPIVGLLAASGESAAATLDYLLDLPADRMLSYRIELEPVHSGTMTIDAEWAPSRVLVFRLVLENGRSMRRSGPSPQSFEVEVRPEEIGRKWTLTFSGLPSRRASSGRMLVGLPDSPDEVEAERRIQEAPAEPGETPPMPSWMLPTRIPAGLSPEWEQVYTTTERFRRRVVESEAPDTYGWQSGMLRYLVGHRELSRARHTPVQPVTREILRRTVALIRELDGLRETGGAALPGPAPNDPVKLRAWIRLRHPSFVPLEDELDALMLDLDRGLAPELSAQPWISGFLNCLLICERHYEERARLGEFRARNGTLAQTQWSPIAAAAAALEALVELPIDD